MEQKRTLGSWISARRYIRDFAADYAARHGENAAEIEKDILQAKKRNHISLNEYEWVGYHDRTEAQKRTMSTLWTRAEFRKNFTDRRYIAILMNKYIFSKVFSDFYGRRCVQASAVDAALLRALAGDAGKVVYKPNCKGQGTGVRILPAATEAEQADTLAYLRANSGGIVEEYIQQHPTLAQLNPGAVSIVRFYTVTAPSGTYLFAPVLDRHRKGHLQRLSGRTDRDDRHPHRCRAHGRRGSEQFHRLSYAPGHGRALPRPAAPVLGRDH